MNLAARLMQRATSEDGGVLCELATKRACRGLLQFKARGDFRIKVRIAVTMFCSYFSLGMGWWYSCTVDRRVLASLVGAISALAVRTTKKNLSVKALVPFLPMNEGECLGMGGLNKILLKR